MPSSDGRRMREKGEEGMGRLLGIWRHRQAAAIMWPSSSIIMPWYSTWPHTSCRPILYRQIHAAHTALYYLLALPAALRINLPLPRDSYLHRMHRTTRLPLRIPHVPTPAALARPHGAAGASSRRAIHVSVWIIRREKYHETFIVAKEGEFRVHTYQYM